ncbi:site-specific DNA-methyltransferase [Polaribacter sp. BAL334]|uniref:site-specific DNA-methyltransferase n=1 Tax=Polaribacter sp. BAL334 TaxID=1708178 RepID=UPI0018D238C4|nr:site-specific DNA-methyltransferase [Polaribacter sp. BAL334]MBG7611051.1 site-specific DNA-methyltransferase [Polaribacter sp. BAL334]
MPTLHWIGKEKVVSHHQDVPYKILDHKYGFTDKGEQKEETKSGNKIIKGDNLEALKSLLPEYEGKVKCIYIDPPYNTGKESWVYNDNVNHPKIKKWLGEVVGKEGDDFTRHDKWLCMMYPRLKLLHKLLSEDGIIFISIDDNEYHNLKYICDIIFSKNNFITNFTWRTDGNFDNQAKIKINHEYILCYSKNSELFEYPEIIDPNITEDSKLYKTEIKNTIVKNGPKNPISEVVIPVGFPCDIKNGIIKARTNSWPHYQSDAIIKNNKLTNEVIVKSGWSSKGIFEKFIKGKFKTVKDSKNQETSFTISKTGAIESIKSRKKASHVVSSLFNMGSTQNMSSALKKMGVDFDYPKSLTLIEYLISIVNGDNFIVLDSFAGSGTTAHAVLNLNKKDDRNRKFISIEMMDYVETITSMRVQKVIKGYSDILGTGGEFDFYELGKPIFKDDENLNEEVGEDKIRNYIYYTETKQPLIRPQSKEAKFLLDNYQDTGYYFYYEKDILTTLDNNSLNIISELQEQYIIYADICLLDEAYMLNKNIIFKKIPRDIKRF